MGRPSMVRHRDFEDFPILAPAESKNLGSLTVEARDAGVATLKGKGMVVVPDP